MMKWSYTYLFCRALFTVLWGTLEDLGPFMHLQETDRPHVSISSDKHLRACMSGAERNDLWAIIFSSYRTSLVQYRGRYHVHFRPRLAIVN